MPLETLARSNNIDVARPRHEMCENAPSIIVGGGRQAREMSDGTILSDIDAL